MTEMHVIRDLQRKAAEDTNSLILRITGLIPDSVAGQCVIGNEIAFQSLKYCLITLMVFGDGGQFQGEDGKQKAIDIILEEMGGQLSANIPALPADTTRRLEALASKAREEKLAGFNAIWQDAMSSLEGESK